MTRHRPPKHAPLGGNADRIYAKKKVNYFKQANSILDEFDKILIVKCDNVQSLQMQHVRQSLRGKATVLMGKNTQLRKILNDRTEAGGEKQLQMYDKIIGEGLLRGNVGFILTNGEIKDVKKLVDENKIQAPARVGSIAPLDVVVPAGNTGLEPTKTSFFQALNIGTKITKGTVEILKDEKVIKKGEKVGSSEATLLQMLGIKPFFYGLELQWVYDNGCVYGPEVLDITDDDMKEKLQLGISRVTGLSLGSGFTTSLSMPHVLMNAFKQAMAVTISTDYTAEKQKVLKESILSGKAAAAPAPAAAAPKAVAKPEAKPSAPAEKKKEAPPAEEEDEDMGLGLFD